MTTVDDPYGIKLELWGMAMDAGLNLDDLDPDPKRFDYGVKSAKARVEREMIDAGVTVEDLKAVDRGDYNDDYYTPYHLWMEEEVKEDPPAAVSMPQEAYDPWEDLRIQKLLEEADDLEEQDLWTRFPRFCIPFKDDRGCKRTNDGDVIKKDDKQMDDGEMMIDEDDDVLCSPNKRLRPLPESPLPQNV